MSLARRHFIKSVLAAPALIAAPQLVQAEGAAPVASPAAGTGVHSFTIGDARVTALLDGHLPLTIDMFRGADAAAAEAVVSGTLHQIRDGAVTIPVNGYLVERGAHKTLIDAGTSNLFGDSLGKLAAALGSTGINPSDITTVLLTHMHPDHSGGLLDASGAAQFANAELVVGAAEWDFWWDDAIMASAPEDARGFFQIARNTTAPYQDRLRQITGEVEAVPGLTAVPLPGHTPGHLGFALDAGGVGLLFWGDVVHSTALQFARPDWSIPFDVDQDQAAATRRAMLDRASSDRLLVTGAHLDFPGLGQVQRAGDAFRFEAAPYQFAL